ncbi:hypothetical protein OU787_02660 [Kitasatospora sp. YST-16]|uniref:hypothetical protein n=1 Tax=Kitasatospora sp. YST-16 TaxID=2998080 RepID=UPI002284CDA3|nr:hypothetical protein [Kitasatospora sp. YST-16]WAL70493.1 hypothetical protein OU787_02660 [Kitasatospora sp. YST-16]WNW36532.1 hypothetical protein RKE32_02655 [Streptomyces sp. Li-HN-5-13]
MNLAWIVAVLRPRDIAPHPNFTDSEYDSQSVARLAGIVSGSRYFRDYGNSSELDEGVRNAELSLTTDGIRVGLNALVREIISHKYSDEARISALGLLACCAAAELDDYDTCDLVLDSLLERVDDRTHSGMLLRVVLLLQQSLRRQDSGRPYESSVAEALGMLDRINVKRIGSFRLSPGASVNSQESLTQLLLSLRQSAWSLSPIELQLGEGSPTFPSWQEVVTTPKSDQGFRLDQMRASEYSRHVSEEFSVLFQSRAKELGGRSAPSLFNVALGLELLGNSSVHEARKEHALLRLVDLHKRSPIDPREAADAIRLLRHSNAKSELDLALEWFRAAGPVSAITIDARNILRSRSKPHMIREVELRVLRASADLLSPDESAHAFQLACEVISAGGAQPPYGSRQIAFARFEPAWLAVAQLANAADLDEAAARILLGTAQSNHPEAENELWDKGIGRALIHLDWDKVDSATKCEWRRVSVGMRAIESVLAAKLDSRVGEINSIQSLDDVARQVNSVISGSPASGVLLRESAQLVRKSLDEIRLNASRNSWSLRSVDAGDIAAALIVNCDVTELWTDLTNFLIDTRLTRSDTSRAFIRLAQYSSELPLEVVEAFKRSSADLLQVATDFFDNRQIVPYPAALRFLAAHGLLEEDRLFALVASLAGSRDSSSREEAAHTIAAIAGRSHSPWAVSLAMQLSHDEEVNVRAHAARALVACSSSQSYFAAAVIDRIKSMLQDEGILVPLLSIMEMRNVGGVPDQIMQTICVLQESHPSLRVRRASSRLISESKLG